MDHAELIGTTKQDFFHLLEVSPPQVVFEHSAKRMLGDDWKTAGRKLARDIGPDAIKKFKKYASK